MNPTTNYILYPHVDSEITTVTEFLDQLGLSIIRGMDREAFLSFEDEFGVSNLEKIWTNYNFTLKQQYEQDYINKNLEHIVLGTIFALPKSYLFLETVAISSSNQVEDVNFDSFLAHKLVQITNDYHKVKLDKTISHKPQIKVFCYCKAIDKVLNLSKLVLSVNTNVDSSGGNFEMSLVDIDLDFTFFSIAEQSQFSSFNVFNTVKNNFNSIKLLEALLTPNDVVFIELDSISKREVPFICSIEEVVSSLLDTKNYDLIGLIDSTSISRQTKNSSISFSVSGRDLIKLFIDDGSYFYPLQFAQQVFINPEEDNKMIKRLAIDGSFILQNQYAYRSIKYTIQFLLNHIANLGVVDDNVFSCYEQKRTLVYRIEDELSTKIFSESSSQRIEEDLRKICKSLVYDKYEEAFNLCTSFAEQLASSPNKIQSNYVIEGYGNFDFRGEILSNQTPGELKQLGLGFWKVVETSGIETVTPTALLKKVFQLAESRSSDSIKNNINETPAKGLWQIVKLIYDKSVADRRIVDASISQPDGSLLEQFNKICQKPFVEFFGDTYEDLYYIIVRQPPFTKKAISQILHQNVLTEQGYEGAQIVEVDAIEVYSQSFSRESRDVFSLYEIKPQGLFLGGGSEVSLAYIPIVYFPQYGNIWGTRRLSVTSNYISYSGLTKNSPGANFIVEQCANDLIYLIETHQYMPFVRAARIEIQLNKSIKRGTWIRYKPTGELYYVDQVSHSSNFSRNQTEGRTVLTLTRGMVEKYIKGVGGVSYFNIVDLQLIKQYLVSSLTGGEKDYSVAIKKNFAVNQPVFDFFKNNRQFYE